jgi:Raf kinase inhibitor-like YbhB/YbcL family protein
MTIRRNYEADAPLDFMVHNAVREGDPMRLTGFVIGVLLTYVSVEAMPNQAPTQAPRAGGPASPGLTLTTSAFADGAEIPARFTQSSESPVSPKLEWTNVPQNTVTFAFIMHDPDVAVQRKTDDVLHWLVFNIPAAARELPEGMPATAQLPDGTVQGKNQGGIVGYRGPGAPAVGPHHHYTWELFALDVKLELGADATRADVLKAMDGHILGKGVLMGRFHR